MLSLPNLLVLGPPKCASTSLHVYLGQHPQVYMSCVKETNSFTHDYSKGQNYYAGFFKDVGNTNAITEATPIYFFLPFAADCIHKDLPELKMIVIIRNPIDRAFSNWLMLKEAGGEKAGFRESIEINLKQLATIRFENDEGFRPYNTRRYKTFSDKNWLRTYFQPGIYAENLNTYYTRFPKELIHTIFMDDLKNAFNEKMESIFGYLQIGSTFIISVRDEKSFYFNKKYVRLLQNVVGIKAARDIVRRLPNNIKNIFKQQKNELRANLKLPKKITYFYLTYICPAFKKLEEITDGNLDNWRPDSIFRTSNITVHT